MIVNLKLRQSPGNYSKVGDISDFQNITIFAYLNCDKSITMPFVDYVLTLSDETERKHMTYLSLLKNLN